MICQSQIHCLFCLGNGSFSALSPSGLRVLWVKPHPMMNEVGKHLKSFAQEDSVACPHSRCKAAGLILPSVMVFKNPTATVHEIFFACIAFICSGTCSISRFYVHFLYPLFALKIHALLNNVDQNPISKHYLFSCTYGLLLSVGNSRSKLDWSGTTGQIN